MNLDQEQYLVTNQSQTPRLGQRVIGKFDHPNEVLLKSFGDDGRKLVKDLARDLVFNRDNPNYLLRLEWASLSGAGKSRSIEQLVHHLDGTLNAEDEDSLPIYFYYHNFMNDVQRAIKSGRVKGPATDLTDQDYWSVQSQAEELWDLAARYLPGPGLMINDTISTRGHILEDGTKVGAPRLQLAGLTRKAAQGTNLRVVFQSTPLDILQANVDFRETILKAPLKKVPDLISDRGLIDPREPKAIKRSYRLSGNRLILDKQIEATILDLYMYQRDFKLEILPDGDYHQFRQLLDHQMEDDPNLLTDHLKNELYPAILDSIFLDKASMYGRILAADFKTQTDRPIQEALLEKHNLVRALVTQALNGDHRLKAAVKWLKAA